MRQPSTHHLRKFIDLARNATGPGNRMIENELIRGVRDELMEHMLYSTELQRLLDISKQNQSQAVTVQIQAEDF